MATALGVGRRLDGTSQKTCLFCYVIRTPGKGFYMCFMLRNNFIAFSCTLCALLFPLVSLCAQEADSLRYVLDEFVVVDTDGESTAVTGEVSHNVNAADIMRYGMQNLADAVRRMPGVSLQDYGGVGGLKTVSIRGLGAKHTAVSYDGVVVSDAQSGMVDLGRFLLENVSEVLLEVGGGEAGMLRTAREYVSSNLLSLRSASSGLGVHSRIKVQGGSFGLASLSASSAYNNDEGLEASLSANYLRSDGAYPFVLVNGNATSREKRRDSDVESLVLEGNLYARPLGGFFSAKLHYYGSERGLPGAVNLYNKENRERLWNRNAFAQAAYVRRLFADADMRVVLKYDYNYSRYREVSANYASGEQIDRNLQNEYYMSLVLGRAGVWSCSVASDISYTTLENNFKDSKEPCRVSSQTVLAAKYQPSGLFSFSASLLATYIRDEVKSGSAPAPYARLSPALSVVYALHPSFYLRASYKDAYRVPTFADLYYLRLGNVGLKPERASQFNVGAVWKYGLSMARVGVSADAYYNKVRDKIVALPTMYIWRMMNFGRADIWGLDVAAFAEVDFSHNFSLKADANYSFQYAVDVTDRSAKNYRHQLPYTPRHSGNCSLALLNPFVNVSYMLTVVGERYMLPQNSVANRMRGYAEHSFSLNRRFSFDGFGLLLQAELLNVGNEHYEVIRNYPMPGFSWRTSVRFEF